jgi:hypothetical protein
MTLGKITEFISPNLCCAPKNIDYLEREKAVAIAEELCLSYGELETTGTYDAQEKMWYFNIQNDTATCSPVCGVSERLKKASIAYECLGPIQKDEKKYASEDIETCKTATIFCDVEQQAFFDIQGCGCENAPPKTKHFCKEKDRKADTCPPEEGLTCGLYDQGLTCREPPCVEEFSSTCAACNDEDIIYWTEGECPE